MMTQTHQTATHIFYQTHLDGLLLKLIRCKDTGELFFNAGSLALALGYPDTVTMLADEYALDTITSYAIKNGGHSICWANGTPIRL